MLGGYVGKLLRVDLTKGTLTDEALPPEDVLRKYIGGLGLSAKILYDELPVGTKPLDPANRLIFMTGPLGGTPAPSSGQCAVAGLSYETGYTIGVGHFHGNFGSTLKFAGYDGLIIQGASPKPVYLWVHDGQAELHDASHLWGKDTHETYQLLREEVGEPLSTSACIGPAGENMVKGASVCTDLHHMAAKGGLGAVMGSKKLKAIAVWGTKGVAIKDPDRFLEVCLEWRKNAWAPTAAAATAIGNAGVTRLFYRLAGERSMIAFKNLLDPDGGTAMGRKILELAKQSPPRPQGSFSCPVACAYRVEIPFGPHKGYVATPGGGGENIEGASGLMAVDEPGTSYWLTELADRAGMDSGTPGTAMALAFELYERGLLTKKDTDGLELKWGNADAVYQLTQKYIRKEGIGAILAEGPKRAAEIFSEKLKSDIPKQCVVHVKGTAHNLHDWRPLWGQSFSYGISTCGPCHQGVGTEYRTETDLGYDAPLNPQTPEGKAEALRRGMIRKHWIDSNGVCWFVHSGVPNNTTLSAQAVNAATGWDITKEEAWAIGERVLNLCRLFSIRRGHSPADDLDFGARLLEAPRSGKAKGKTGAPHFKDMLREYYTLMGWDPDTGIPKPDTLAKAGLQDYAKDIADIKVPAEKQLPNLELTPVGFVPRKKGEG